MAMATGIRLTVMATRRTVTVMATQRIRMATAIRRIRTAMAMAVTGAFIVLVRMLVIGPPDELRSIVLVGTEELARPLSLTPASGFAEQQEQRVGESLTGKLRRRRGVLVGEGRVALVTVASHPHQTCDSGPFRRKPIALRRGAPAGRGA